MSITTCAPSTVSLISSIASLRFLETPVVEYSLCFCNVISSPSESFSLAYTSSELSKIATSATSSSVIVPMSASSIVINSRFFTSSILANGSPTFTASLSSSLQTYPAGSEKFSAVRRFAIISAVIVPPISAFLSASSRASSNCS